MICKFCGKTGTNKSISQHEIRCKKNLNRINMSKKGESNPNFGKSGKNQHTKAKNEGRIVEVSDETKKKIGNAAKKQKWTVERRNKLSVSMKKAVEKFPSSYSASNINGRTKKLEYNGFILDGSWELEVAKWLDKNSIEWIKNNKGFEYQWNGKRVYYPDYYLPKLNLYIEVKGFERERDRIKWRVVENLIVLKKLEIQKIKDSVFSIEELVLL